MSKFFSFTEALPAAYLNSRKDSPSIQYIQYEPGKKIETALFFSKIILITAGNLFISYDTIFNREIIKGKMILLPSGCQFTAYTKAGVSILVFRLKEIIQFCNGQTIRDLSDNNLITIRDLYSLDSKPEIESFISQLQKNLNNGLIDENYLKLKIEELFYLFRSYYTREELTNFFSPLLSADAQFHNFVLQNYHTMKTVKDFADKYKCSVSNFDKRFRQTFGISTFQWLKQKKINLLYHEINATTKSLKQIAEEQNFLSLPQFNDYCKKHFGYPPGKMRKLAYMFHAKEQGK